MILISKIFSTGSLWNLIFVNQKEWDNLSDAGRRLLLYHEEIHTHQSTLYKIRHAKKAELEATRGAIARMIQEGYDPSEMLEEELFYRFFYKYGITFDKFKEDFELFNNDDKEEMDYVG